MPDLYTNLVLNDTQFKQGLARVDQGLAGLEARVKSISRASEFAQKVLKFGGVAEIFNQLVRAATEFSERQARLADGAETFRDRWEESKGIVNDIIAAIPFVGKSINDFRFVLDGGQMQQVRDAGMESLRKMSAEMRLQKRLIDAQSEPQRRLIKLEDDRLRKAEQINAAAAKAGVSSRKQIEELNALFNAQKKAIGGGLVLQGGLLTGSGDQLPQFFGLDWKTYQQKAKPFTTPGTPLPKPGPTTAPQQLKAAEDTARNTKETAQLLSVIARKIGTYA